MVAELILIPENPASLEQAKQCAQYVARGLSAIGMKVREQISLCSNKAELQKAVSIALTRSNTVFTLGGLGVAQNYITKTVLCEGLQIPLVENTAALEEIRNYCKRTGEPFLSQDNSLAMQPQGSVVFPGQYGKTPGCAISSAKQHIIMLPDNQAEAAAILNKYVVPYLSGSAAQTTITKTVRTYGVKEDAVRHSLGEILDTGNPAVTVLSEGNEVFVKVSAHAATAGQAHSLAAPVLRAIVDKLGDAAYGLDVDSLQSAVINKLDKKELDISIAESGSDGMLTRIIAETPGGADVLRYSVAVDTPAAKVEKLNLSHKTLKKQGDVSEYCAVMMANAVREKAKTAIGVAITANTADEKSKKSPVGLVYIAVCDANNVYVKKLVVGSGDMSERDGVIDACVSRALNMIRLFIDYLPRKYPGAILIDDAFAGVTVTDKESYDRDSLTDSKEVPKQKGFFGRFFGNFIIRKADEKGVKVRKFIFILAVLIFLGSAGYLGKYYLDSYFAANQAKYLSEIFSYGEADNVEISSDFPKEYLPQFAALWSINPDVVGFLSIEDTQVQYPIVQSADNDYYLRRDFYAENNQHGIPFMDYRDDVEKPSDNLIIYGHNMKDGQIFGEVVQYEKLDYYKAHPVINFSTIHDEAQYKIVSVFITNAYTNQGPVFEYHNFIDAASKDDFEKYLNQIKIRSLINTTVDVKPGDDLLTLSTCTYEFKDARFVVVARKVRKGESAEVDVDGAIQNPQPLRPDIWYKTFGGSKPEGLDSAYVVTTPTTNPSSTAQKTSSTATVTSSSIVSSKSSSEGGQTQISQSSAETSSASQSASQSSSQSQSSSKASSSSKDEGIFAGISRDESQNATVNQPDEGVVIDPSKDKDVVINVSMAAKIPSPALPTTAAEVSQNQVATEVKPIDIVEVKAQINEPSIFDGLNLKPDSSTAADNQDEGEVKTQTAANNLTVYVGGEKITASEQEIVSRIVQNEIGSAFHTEAIKAQAVAAYTFILYHNNLGQTPSVILSKPTAVSKKVDDAVAAVIGQAVYYNNKLAFTPYHATSAGQTTSSQSVWGGSYPYLVSVESPQDKQTTYYKVAKTFTREKVESLLYEKLGITASGAPEDWFEVLSETDGGYNGEMAVCGYTKNQKTGAKITGRVLRENVFVLRSAYFTVDYNADSDKFTFTTCGYGHGVGLSQNGANQYALQGYSYDEILEHYYIGAEVK